MAVNMILTKSKSKNAISFYVCEGYRKKDGTSSTRVVLKLGTEKDIKAKYGEDIDAEQWARDYVKQLNEDLKNNKPIPINLELIPDTPYAKNEKKLFNVGYIFLEKELDKLGLAKIVKDITARYKFKYNLEQILRDLVTSRILQPCSKKSSYEYATEHYLHEVDYCEHDVYRALDVIGEESDFIQKALYQHSNKEVSRNTAVLFYDCTNFFFESSEEDELRKFGKSKENRPNPIVQMGLFMDGNGVPLGFDIFPGNQNEQISLKPLEQKILRDFELSGAKIIVCTDAGLASTANRKLNSIRNRDFITIQPIKKMTEKEQEWVLSRGRSLLLEPIGAGENANVVLRDIKNNGWRVAGDKSNTYISLDDIDEDDIENLNKIYYKEKYLVDDKTGFTQRLIVTYSLKYKKFMEHKRSTDIKRALKLISLNQKKKIEVSAQNDVRRYISTATTTKDGTDIKCDIRYELNESEIIKQAKYDGFYAVCTSIEKDEKTVEEIININRWRWEIEESFRLLKSEFKSRPVYVYLKEHIKAHFTICFMALTLFRLLEKKVNAKSDTVITAPALIKTLQNMNITKYNNYYTGSFKRTDITDILHSFIDMRFDCELITQNKIKKILK